MSTRRLTHFLMGLIAMLLLANLVRPILAPVAAFAESDAKLETPATVSGNGYTAWILKKNQIYYVTWDTNFRKIQIYGPKELDKEDYDPSQPVAMTGSGNSAWVVKGDQVFFVNATNDNNFVNLNVEHPEDLPR